MHAHKQAPTSLFTLASERETETEIIRRERERELIKWLGKSLSMKGYVNQTPSVMGRATVVA